MASIRFSVPATSANLGPGFDCLGLALGLRNTITLTEADKAGISLNGAADVPTGPENLTRQAMARTFEVIGAPYEGPLRHLHVETRIPVGSGMGSSAAAIVAGVMAAHLVSALRLPTEELIQVAVEVEGHPDNVVPAMFGGLTISSHADGRLLVRGVPLKPMSVVVVLPDVTTSTKEMRAALPREVTMGDASANIGRALLVVEALRSADYALLRDAMVDRLHVPTRSRAIPGYGRVVAAAREAGAAAVTISGAGPAMIAFTDRGHDRIRQAMVRAFREGGVKSRSWMLPVDTDGFRVEA